MALKGTVPLSEVRKNRPPIPNFEERVQQGIREYEADPQAWLKKLRQKIGVEPDHSG